MFEVVFFFLVRLIFNEKRLFLFVDLFLGETYHQRKRLFCLKLIFFLVRHKIIKLEKGKSEQETCLQHFSRYKTGNLNFWDEELFNMGPYICQNFQLLMLYNFQFHHMVWKRFPTVLKSFSIFVRKGGKMTKIKFLERGFLRDVLLHIGENFQNDIRDIFQFFHMVKNSIFDFWYSKNKENQIFGTRSSLGWVLTYVRTFGMTFQTLFSFIIWV